jgi:hypothetical protein
MPRARTRRASFRSAALARIDEVARSWFTEATAHADFNRDEKPDVAAMPIGPSFVPQPPVVLTSIVDPALTDVTDQVIEGERPTLGRANRTLVAGGLGWVNNGQGHFTFQVNRPRRSSGRNGQRKSNGRLRKLALVPPCSPNPSDEPA